MHKISDGLSPHTFIWQITHIRTCEQISKQIVGLENKITRNEWNARKFLSNTYIPAQHIYNLMQTHIGTNGACVSIMYIYIYWWTHAHTRCAPRVCRRTSIWIKKTCPLLTTARAAIDSVRYFISIHSVF
jgi:hypothetical protein